MYFLQAFKPIGLDLLATIFFVTVYWLSGSILLGTALGVGAGIARFAYMKYRRQPIGPLQYVSIILVVASGVTTLITHNPLFVQVKSSIITAAVGIVMLRTNWMDPYLPPIVKGNLDPRIILWSSHVWGALQIVLAIANVVVALAFSFNSWAWYASIVPSAAQLLVFLFQYVTFRTLIRRSIRARLALQAVQQPCVTRQSDEVDAISVIS
jgi:intracellular septation protein A